MVSDTVELPFFPKYDTEYLYDKKLRVTWFEANFSQTHYNVHNACKGSNACTLIAVNEPEKSLNIRLIQIVSRKQLEGNKIHDYLKMEQLIKHINLNVPEASNMLITLVDSHQHDPDRGAFIAITKIPKLKYSASGTVILFKYYHSEPQLYELSFLFSKKLKKYKYCGLIHTLSSV
nr:unnamed protein product [Callosobruchus analis]